MHGYMHARTHGHARAPAHGYAHAMCFWTVFGKQRRICLNVFLRIMEIVYVPIQVPSTLPRACGQIIHQHYYVPR